MQVPDSAVSVSGNTLTITLTNVPVVDQGSFPGGAGNNLGMAGAPATVSLSATYVKSGMPRRIAPTSADPLSPFSWAGEMWTATNSGTFSVAYNDGTFSAQGSFASSGNFGEMGRERNGSFVSREEIVKTLAQAAARRNAQVAGGPIDASATPGVRAPMFKGKVPIGEILHQRPQATPAGAPVLTAFDAGVLTPAKCCNNP